jgi:hypothetical protein
MVANICNASSIDAVNFSNTIQLAPNSQIEEGQTTQWPKECVRDCCLKPIFQLYYGKNRLIINEIMMRSTLH